jgi:hypothetical protein
MGGGNSQAQQIQQSTAQEQLNLEQQYAQTAAQYLGYGQSLQQPFVQQQQALASGNPEAVISAAGPQLGNISKGYQQAAENIYNTTQPGAGQQEALAQLPIQQTSQTSSYLNGLITQAPQNLAQLGASYLGLGTTQEGAAQGAGTLSNSAAGSIVQENNQSKASTMSFLGSLAGAAASPFSFGGG